MSNNIDSRSFLLILQSGARQSLVSFLTSVKDQQKNDNWKSTIDSWKNSAELIEEINKWLRLSDKTDDPVCHLFYEWFNSGDEQLELFVLCFVPTLVEIYLTNLHSTKKVHLTSGIEAVFLSIYGSRVRSRGGKPITWNPPNLLNNSVYHTVPSALPKSNGHRRQLSFANSSSSVSTENEKEQTASAPIILESALPLIGNDGIRLHERERILREIFKLFNESIGDLPSCVLNSYCAMIGRLCSSGFPFYDENSVVDQLSSPVSLESRMRGISSGKTSAQSERIPLSPPILQSMAEGLHYCLYHKSSNSAAQLALTPLEKRASYELIPQILVMTRAIHRTSASQRKTTRVLVPSQSMLVVSPQV
eukprot:TRINITY_DN9150_c0_g1_i1.p1 TRINITY_DN9150_c0_g1~~TRINITY_DN9150_c0_g1_i1.p1  ORF type:complete len:375 (-),score=83.93 TRINITY_DN9150_c0_g1_i1:56-1144(-)